MKNILNHLIKTMKEVVEAELPLVMDNWFHDYSLGNEATTVQNCKTPACVMGYGSIGTGISATDLSIELDRQIGECLAASIYEPTHQTRRAFASETRIATNYNHLQFEDPTAADSLEYLLAVQEHKK